MVRGSGKTVFVVGAGASKEFGLPVGSELQDDISTETLFSLSGQTFRAFTNNERFFHLLTAAVGLDSFSHSDELRLRQKSMRIADGVKVALSIDNFLHLNKSDSELVSIGKLAIASCILKAESESSIGMKSDGGSFSRSQRKTIIGPHNSWLGKLTKYLSAANDFEGFCRSLDSITFVCFNYDRCIERFLFHAILGVIGIPTKVLTDLAK